MLPTIPIPIGRGLGLVLLAVAIAWCVRVARPPAERRARAWLPLSYGALVGLAGVVLLVRGQVAVFAYPTYGLMMLVGSLLVLALGIRWARQRGLRAELIVELGLLGFFCGLLGARSVFLIEQWDVMFADRPAGIASPGLLSPLEPGDTLALRSQAGAATIRFTGAERDTTAVLAAIEAQSAPAALRCKPKRTQHRGARGVETSERGFLIQTEARGALAELVVEGGAALPHLGLGAGTRARGEHVPWLLVLDLSKGGLTYFGSAIGVLLSWVCWLRYRRVSVLLVLDVMAPTLPLGLFFGRLGCLARSCCWGREAGDGALPERHVPPWSLPWQQMAHERLTCDFDRLLEVEQTLTPEMQARLGDLVHGTPPLHAAQLYEGLSVFLVFWLLVAYRRAATRVGQTFCLLVLLQAPIRFVVEHYRRDLDVFFHLPGLDYALTESQCVALIALTCALPAFVWVSRRGAPLPAPPPRDAASAADTPAEATPPTAAA